MKRRPWDTFRDTLEIFELPPWLEKTARWVERHPRTVLAGALLVVMTVALTRPPAEPAADHEPYNGETPLFV